VNVLYSPYRCAHLDVDMGVVPEGQVRDIENDPAIVEVGGLPIVARQRYGNVSPVVAAAVLR
jgi:hypothetical protein